MELFIVCEEDRGAGVMIRDVFTDKTEAMKLCAESGHYYIDTIEANGIKPPLCDVALTNEDKDLFTEIMGRMLDIKEKPGTLCFCMEEILKHFYVKRKRDFA